MLKVKSPLGQLNARYDEDLFQKYNLVDGFPLPSGVGGTGLWYLDRC